MNFLNLLLVPLLFLTMTTHVQARNVDPEIFEQAVRRQMDGRVMGYAFAIADADGIVAEVSGGWAQAPGDGDLRMSPTIPIGFGSNQKVLSGVALLDLLENRSPLTVEQELNTPFRFFIPDKWINAYFGLTSDSPLNNVKLEDLLDHTSGLANEQSNGGSQGTKIALALSQSNTVETNTELTNNVFDYENGNYTLLLYIIPVLAYREEVDAIEREAESMGLVNYNRHVGREYGKLYTRYMTEKFLSRVPASVTATCRPGDLPNRRYAKQYNNRNSTRGFTDNADDFCRSQGSWSYSVRDMAHIWRTMEFGNRIVQPSTRDLYRANLSGPRLIYWRSFTHQFLAKDTTTDIYRGHGGRTPTLGGISAVNNRANSVGIRLPWEYVGIGAINSDEMRSPQLGTVLLNAFYLATRDTYEKDIDRPGSDITSMDLNDPDPALCADTCDGNPSCLSWTFVAPGIQDPTLARCWLKDNIPVKQARGGLISGVKGLEYGIDRPGSDIRSVVLQLDDAAACRLHCLAESQCRSWTFVRAGVQQPSAVCWLKNSIPAARSSDCCVSARK